MSELKSQKIHDLAIIWTKQNGKNTIRLYLART